MTTRTVGTVRPLWALEDEGAGKTGADVAPGAKVDGDPNAGGNGGEGDQNGSVAFDAEKTFADLDTDTREWLQKLGLDKDPLALARKAREQEKLVGNAIRKPGKDAKPEEVEAFLDKLGRPKQADGYAFNQPKDMPEGLPYDGEKAKSFKDLSHKLGLTQDQAAGLHDWFVGDNVTAYKGMTAQSQQALQDRATKATEGLVKEWGPLDGTTASANFEIADKVFSAPGGAEALQELKDLGLVGPNKEILSVPIAKLFASIGTALYTEDGILRGKVDELDNPFSDKSENLTLQMKIIKEDPDRASSLIQAAGKKNSDFGLKT